MTRIQFCLLPTVIVWLCWSFIRLDMFEIFEIWPGRTLIAYSLLAFGFLCWITYDGLPDYLKSKGNRKRPLPTPPEGEK